MYRKLPLNLMMLASAISFTACSTVTASQYEATALTIYTWQVPYSIGSTDGPPPRLEEFASTSLLNRNGLKPAGAVTGPDDQGLWWPALPPRPSVDEIEQRQQSPDKPGTPELLRTVKYTLTYQQAGQPMTLPTNYDVYRTVVKAYPERTPLELTLGVGDRSVEKAEPQ